MMSSIEKRLQAASSAAFRRPPHNKGIHRMRKSLLALLLVAAGGLAHPVRQNNHGNFVPLRFLIKHKQLSKSGNNAEALSNAVNPIRTRRQTP
jgi:hypothetical protein